MNLGMIGLGKMGSNMVHRLIRGGHRCFVYDVNPENVRAIAKEGATPCFSMDEFVKSQPQPRVVWMMVPAGEVTESVVMQLKELLSRDDVVVDGGNSHFKDDIRRAKLLAESGIQYMDVGTSGGVWGLERGYCMMIGGPENGFRRLEPILSTLAPGLAPGAEETRSTATKGYLHCGPVGSGHFVKMIHNGIEYGMMQAFAEGFEILAGANSENLPSDYQYPLNLKEIAEVWRRGSVVSSWLLDLLAIALKEDPHLSNYIGSVEDSGEGRWTVQAAIEEAISADVISAALFARFRSRKQHTFGEKVLSAMRHEFGGHVEKTGSVQVPYGQRKAV